MTVTLEIPDEIAAQIAPGRSAISRGALEALAIEAYRRGALAQVEVGRLLNLSRIETEDFLAQYVTLYDYEPSELEREAAALRTLADRPR